jgi:CRISPR system Cascade subunit CasB
MIIMTEAINSKDTLNSFIGYLYALRDNDDRGALAHLRRGMGQPPCSNIETASVVERQLAAGTREDVRNACYIVGPLFALHDLDGGSSNMGRHFRELGDPGQDPPPNVEKRFKALLASEKDELPDALRQAVALLKSKGVPVNWFQLAQDVQSWHFDEGRESVRKRWARSFWNSDRKEAGNMQPTTVNP